MTNRLSQVPMDHAGHRIGCVMLARHCELGNNGHPLALSAPTHEYFLFRL